MGFRRLLRTPAASDVNVSVQATNLVAHVAQTLTELAKAVAL